jgi:two-component system response regulator FixJ
MTEIRCVLVVDGDQSARRGLARLLRVAGHDVRECASADEFLDVLEPEMSGCVVLDLRMPGLSAEELQAELDSRGADLPIIVVTAHDDAETRRQARAMKAVALFRKPVDGRALLDTVAWAQR